MADPVDLCNQALAQIGYHPLIADMYEGSAASRIALNIYGQTRDEILRLQDWDFARKTLPLALSGLTPPLPWTYAYSYPADCLYLRDVLPPAALISATDPIVIKWAVADDDQGGAAQKVILANQLNALACYTAQILILAQWDPVYTSAVISRLARKFAQGLAGPNQQGPAVAKSDADEAAAAVVMNRTG